MNAFIVFSACVAAATAQVLPPTYASGYLPYGYHAAPVAQVAPTVVAKAAPIAAPVSSQFQAQDEFGNLNYGYSNINSAKQEVGNTYGGVTGSYQYIDAYGIPQRVDYVADNQGFRVRATNLPVAPIHEPKALPIAPVFEGQAPLPVEETPEVIEAKKAFFKAYDLAANREKRSVAVAAPLAYAGYAHTAPLAAPVAYAGYAHPAPIATYAHPAPVATYAHPAPVAAYAAAPVAVGVSAPAVRDAVMTTIKLNPGHATMYRVD